MEHAIRRRRHTKTTVLATRTCHSACHLPAPTGNPCAARVRTPCAAHPASGVTRGSATHLHKHSTNAKPSPVMLTMMWRGMEWTWTISMPSTRCHFAGDFVRSTYGGQNCTEHSMTTWVQCLNAHMAAHRALIVVIMHVAPMLKLQSATKLPVIDATEV
jgi:hypothetical protein